MNPICVYFTYRVFYWKFKMQYMVEQVQGNEFVYRGWTVEFEVDTTHCSCCDVVTTSVMWRGTRYVDGVFQHTNDVQTFEEVFHEIDRVSE